MIKLLLGVVGIKAAINQPKMNKLSETSVLILRILGLVLITGCGAPPSVAPPAGESERSEGGQGEGEITQDSTEDRNRNSLDTPPLYIYTIEIT